MGTVRRSRRFAPILPALAALVLTGCAGTTALQLDTAAKTTGALAGVGFGSPEMVYSGEVANGTLCVWVDVGGGDLVSLRWPAGAHARTDPLRVENAKGQVIARIGDHLTGREGGSSVEAPGCHLGATRTFVLEEPPE